MAELADVGRQLVDLHGQHAHQSLLQPAAQRRALDQYAGLDTAPLREAAAEVRRLVAELAGLGGDEAARARELDFLRFQLAEIEAAGLDDADEDVALEAEEDLLGDAQAHQEAAAAAHEALAGDGGVGDGLAAAIAAVRGRAPLRDLEERARNLAAELADLAAEARSKAEAIEPDPERLEQIRTRRQHLRDLHRKYGAPGGASRSSGGSWPTCSATYGRPGRSTGRTGGPRGAGRRPGRAASTRPRADWPPSRPGWAGPDGRRHPAWPPPPRPTWPQLAMPGARLEVAVEGDDPGDEVTFLLAANPGAPLLPLAKVASGGELARAMLALRLVLHESAGPEPNGGADAATDAEADGTRARSR